MTLTHEDLTAISHLIDSRLDDKLAKQTEQIKVEFEMQDTKINTRFFIQDARYEKLINEVSTRLDKVDERLDRVDERFDEANKRLDEVEHNIRKIMVVELENRIHPVLKDVVNMITTTSKRYHMEADKIKDLEDGLCVVTAVTKNHADRLIKLEHAG